MSTKELTVRQPLRVFVGWPAPHCQVEGCERSAAGTIVWMPSNMSALNCNDICAWHRFRLKGGLRYPLGVRPPLEQILLAVNSEIQRRQRPTWSYQTTSTFTWS